MQRTDTYPFDISLLCTCDQLSALLVRSLPQDVQGGVYWCLAVGLCTYKKQLKHYYQGDQIIAEQLVLSIVYVQNW